MNRPKQFPAIASLALLSIAGAGANAAENAVPPSSYTNVIEEEFGAVMARMKAQKAQIQQRHSALLNERYDLANRAAAGVSMSRGKPVQDGVRVKLRSGTSWDALAALAPEEIRNRDLWPAGFYPLPHPNHGEGGMLFPKFQIDEVNRQARRDLARFDLDFDFPDHLLPEFPAPIYLTTRPDLGDVSQGKLVTSDNYYELFNGVLNPKQLEGLRLLVVPFPQQQFNLTADRRSERPSLGVACFDCHSNGHSNVRADTSTASVLHTGTFRTNLRMGRRGQRTRHHGSQQRNTC